MIRCITIDDEPLALGQIKAYISKVPFLEHVAEFSNAIEAQQFLEREGVDLIYVDINMPDLTGTEFVRSLSSQQRPMVIFTTAYSEYAIEGFKLDALDYLLKPFSLADFERSAQKALSLYELIKGRGENSSTQSEAEPSDNDNDHISIRADHKVSLIKVRDIIYIESSGEYVRLHLADGTRIMTLFRIKNIEATLPSELFMRVHRSYIVNLKCITGYARGRVFLNNNEYVPIGENYKEQFQNYIRENYPTL
ncbi:MAG: response regulator transcription factor [Alistipes sp.]|nr:response regulator transcription factor [Alistipes sp.]